MTIPDNQPTTPLPPYPAAPASPAPAAAPAQGTPALSEPSARQTPPYQAQAPSYQPQAPRPIRPTTLAQTNAFALVSVILAFIYPLAGVIFGHISLSQIKRNGDAGRGLALTGVIVGYAVMVIAILAVIAYISFIVFIIGAAASGIGGVAGNEFDNCMEIFNDYEFCQGFTS